MSSDVERPRLREACRVLERAGSLVIRYRGSALRVAPKHRDVAATLVARLDGEHTVEEALAALRGLDGFMALRLLRDLEVRGMIGAAPAERPLRADDDRRLDGRRVVLWGEGPMARALGARLADLGAVVEAGDLDADLGAEDTLVRCPEGPDVAALDAANREALERGVRWVAVFVLGDEVIVGPWITPRDSACFRCFELRWTGISPCIAGETAYFERLRGPALAEETAVATRAAARIAHLAASRLALALRQNDRDHVAVIPIPEGEPTSHPVVRHPLCDACGGDAAAPLEPVDFWSGVALALPDLARSLEPLVDDRCGLAAGVDPREIAIHTPPGLPEVVLTRFAIPRPGGATGEQSNWCHGSSVDRAAARTISVVESLERYAGLAAAGSVIVAPYEALGSEAIFPPSLPLFSEAQYAQDGFPFARFRPDRRVSWVAGHSLTAGARRLVPAAAVYFGEDDVWLQESSSGMAAHSSMPDAVLRALLEVVERDAFMIHWLHRLAPPLLEDADIDADPPSGALAAHVRRAGYTLAVADLTTDLDVPVALAMARRVDREGPALLLGAGASLSPIGAVRHALKELYGALVAIAPGWVPAPAKAIDSVESLEDHAGAYQHPSWLEHASFLWSSASASRRRAEAGADAGPAGLRAIVDRLAALQLEAIAVDVTPPDVRPGGLVVVRAIVPGIQPIGFGKYASRLGGRRLYEAPSKMGYASTSLDERDLNPIPHCFP